jgi:hypothetical protein
LLRHRREIAAMGIERAGTRAAILPGMTTKRLISLPASVVAASLAWSAPASASPEGSGLGGDVANPPNEVTLRALDPTVPTEFHTVRRTSIDIGGGVQSIAARDDGQCLDLCVTSGVDVYALVPVSTRVAVVSRIWGRSLMDGLDSVTYGMSTGGLRYSLYPGVWVETGFGLARATVDRDQDIDVSMGIVSPAAVAGGGVDLGTVAGFDLGIEVRGGSNLYSAGVEMYNADLILAAAW